MKFHPLCLFKPDRKKAATWDMRKWVSSCKSLLVTEKSFTFSGSPLSDLYSKVNGFKIFRLQKWESLASI